MFGRVGRIGPSLFLEPDDQSGVERGDGFAESKSQSNRRSESTLRVMFKARYTTSIIAASISRTVPKSHLRPLLTEIQMNTTATLPKRGQSNAVATQDGTVKKPQRGDKPQNSDKSEGYKGGRRNESREVQISKACSYILRHGAAKESLVMRSDGYVRVDELVS